MQQEPPQQTDVALVGAGPIGIEMAVALRRAGLDFVHFEAAQIGQAIAEWPPATHFFSSPERVAIAGVPIQNRDQQHPTGEEYLAYLRSVVLQFDLAIHTFERVLTVLPDGERFRLRTVGLGGERLWLARRVVLATGGMAGPRRLNIPGEDLPHIDHRFLGPHKYFRRKLLVVGGRNSAGAQVTLSYRRAEFDPDIVKPHLFKELAMRIRDGQISVLGSTAPIEIRPGEVVFTPTDAQGKPAAGGSIRHPTDFVLLCVGFEADTSLFEQAGVELVGAERAPRFDPETMQTNVPGLYVAGTAVAGTQQRFKVFIENSHDHVTRILAALANKSIAVPGRDSNAEFSEEW